MLEVEDVAFTVDDMGSGNRSGSLVQRGLSEGRRDNDTRAGMMKVHCRTVAVQPRQDMCLSCLSQVGVKGKQPFENSCHAFRFVFFNENL